MQGINTESRLRALDPTLELECKRLLPKLVGPTNQTSSSTKDGITPQVPKRPKYAIDVEWGHSCLKLVRHVILPVVVARINALRPAKSE